MIKTARTTFLLNSYLICLFFAPGLLAQTGAIDVTRYELTENESSTLEFSVTARSGGFDRLEIQNPFSKGTLAVETISRNKPGLSPSEIFMTTDAVQFSARRSNTALVNETNGALKITFAVPLESSESLTIRLRVGVPHIESDSAATPRILRGQLSDSRNEQRFQKFGARRAFRIISQARGKD